MFVRWVETNDCRSYLGGLCAPNTLNHFNTRSRQLGDVGFRNRQLAHLHQFHRFAANFSQSCVYVCLPSCLFVPECGVQTRWLCMLPCMWGSAYESSVVGASESFASRASPISSRRRLCAPLVSGSPSKSIGRSAVRAEAREEFTKQPRMCFRV